LEAVEECSKQTDKQGISQQFDTSTQSLAANVRSTRSKAILFAAQLPFDGGTETAPS